MIRYDVMRTKRGRSVLLKIKIGKPIQGDGSLFIDATAELQKANKSVDCMLEKCAMETSKGISTILNQYSREISKKFKEDVRKQSLKLSGKRPGAVYVDEEAFKSIARGCSNCTHLNDGRITVHCVGCGPVNQYTHFEPLYREVKHETN